MAGRDLSGRTLSEGKFVIREKLGNGGYADVYRCDEPLLEREVVVKVLHETKWRSDEAQKRFKREARLASLLDHPYAAHVYASGIERSIEGDDDLAWIAMELVQGVTLRSWVKTHGLMPLEVFVPFFDSIAEAVKTAHDRGIVHRDLTASNIMVIHRGRRILPRLIDFGIAKVDLEVEAAWATTDPDEVMSECLQGTPQLVQRTNTDRHPLTGRNCAMGSKAYMSPEQWRDAGSVGPATDIYALGVIIYLTSRVSCPSPRRTPMSCIASTVICACPSLAAIFPVPSIASSSVRSRSIPKGAIATCPSSRQRCRRRCARPSAS